MRRIKRGREETIQVQGEGKNANVVSTAPGEKREIVHLRWRPHKSFREDRIFEQAREAERGPRNRWAEPA